jgi:hypothetical protein
MFSAETTAAANAKAAASAIVTERWRYLALLWCRWQKKAFVESLWWILQDLHIWKPVTANLAPLMHRCSTVCLAAAPAGVAPCAWQQYVYRGGLGKAGVGGSWFPVAWLLEAAIGGRTPAFNRLLRWSNDSSSCCIRDCTCSSCPPIDNEVDVMPAATALCNCQTVQFLFWKRRSFQAFHMWVWLECLGFVRRSCFGL